ncbi:MAG: transcriptional repressor [Spirochaetales bacterium]|nr:transcriptional repressor [Spirochaetales bacterium]
MERHHQWRNRLQDQGYRLTISREVIIDTLGKNTGHLSAEDIYMTIHGEHPSIGLTTIYRTLEILTRMGITIKFDFGDGRTRYELSEEYGNKKHHHHLICTECAKIIDYTDFVDEELELLHKTENELSLKYKFKITKHLIRFYGLCDNCQK